MNISHTFSNFNGRKHPVEVITDWQQFPTSLRGGSLTIGNFDGVHLGHHIILNQLKSFSKKLSAPSVVFTFDPHPIAVLRPDFRPAVLTTMDQRVELLANQGIDAVVVCQTSRQFLNLNYSQFFHSVVLQAIGAKAMVEGPNFFFGKDQGGNVDRLKDLCRSEKIELEIVQPKTDGDGEKQLVSSSLIRQMLSEGQMEKVARHLGRNYSIKGTVTTGDQRGRNLGFPTANLESVETMLPTSGVYAGRCEFEGDWFPVAVNIGRPSTFEIQQDRVEAHLIGFQGDLYDRSLSIELISKIRDGRKFSGPDDLVKQIKTDVAQVNQLVATKNKAQSKS